MQITEKQKHYKEVLFNQTIFQTASPGYSSTKEES